MNEIQKAIQDARSAQANRVFNSFSNSKEVGEIDENIAKSQEDELEKGSKNPFEKEASEELFEKGGKAAVAGEVRTWHGKQFRKQPNGKWLEVSEYGMTKKEHSDKVEFHSATSDAYAKKRDWNNADKEVKELRKHGSARIKLSDKEYSDEEIGEGFEIIKSAASEAENELKKSDIMGSLEYGNEIKISKTGKEIKDQIDSVILPELNASLLVKKNQADEKLKNCGAAPTKEPETYWTNGIKIDCDYKIYPWDETYIPETSNRNMMSSLSAEDSKEKKGNIPESVEQAESRRSYNDIIREISNILVDIKACEILNTLKDETDYELTPRQAVTFRF